MFTGYSKNRCQNKVHLSIHYTNIIINSLLPDSGSQPSLDHK